jgi:hypothetical protein
MKVLLEALLSTLRHTHGYSARTWPKCRMWSVLHRYVFPRYLRCQNVE